MARMKGSTALNSNSVLVVLSMVAPDGMDSILSNEDWHVITFEIGYIVVDSSC